jgi:hypothetical protein
MTLDHSYGDTDLLAIDRGAEYLNSVAATASGGGDPAT